MPVRGGDPPTSCHVGQEVTSRMIGPNTRLAKSAKSALSARSSMRRAGSRQDRPWASFGAALACLSNDRTRPPRANLESPLAFPDEPSPHRALKPNEVRHRRATGGESAATCALALGTPIANLEPMLEQRVTSRLVGIAQSITQRTGTVMTMLQDRQS